MMQIALWILIVIVLAYVALCFWRWRNGLDWTGKSKGFRPHIGFTLLDGMSSLSVLLDNGPGKPVWVEEIEIFLSDLVAVEQTTSPTLNEFQKIRQVVRPHDMLPISLSHAIYKAAGNPQRRYACVLSSVVRYKIGEECSEEIMKDHKIRMAGLTAVGMDRGRKPVAHFPARKKSPQNDPIAGFKPK